VIALVIDSFRQALEVLEKVYGVNHPLLPTKKYQLQSAVPLTATVLQKGSVK
jgi:hypothetical protein